VLILDLTENNFTGLDDLKFLFEFTRLKTLILDKNQVQSNIRIPFLPSLLTLWVNHNQIENLAIFVENVASACPNLTYLSMMNNRAAPSYFNGGSLAEYNDYRFYTISKLVDLKMLDDRQITPEER
jgi:Leucine-rich repeat (LRR) protein